MGRRSHLERPKSQKNHDFDVQQSRKSIANGSFVALLFSALCKFEELQAASPPPSDFEGTAAADHRTIISESEAEATQPTQPRPAVTSNAQPKELSRPIKAIWKGRFEVKTACRKQSGGMAGQSRPRRGKNT